MQYVLALGAINHSNPLASPPETEGFEISRAGYERVLPRVVGLLRRGGGEQLRHGGRVLRLLLLADVVGYRDGGECPYDNDHDQQLGQG